MPKVSMKYGLRDVLALITIVALVLMLIRQRSEIYELTRQIETSAQIPRIWIWSPKFQGGYVNGASIATVGQWPNLASIRYKQPLTANLQLIEAATDTVVSECKDLPVQSAEHWHSVVHTFTPPFKSSNPGIYIVNIDVYEAGTLLCWETNATRIVSRE
jgi:hypothetical protein